MTRYVIAMCGMFPWAFVAAAAVNGPRLWMMIVQACLSLIGFIAALRLDYMLYSFNQGRRA